MAFDAIRWSAEEKEVLMVEVSDLWGDFSSALLKFTVQESHTVVDGGLVEILCEHIRRVEGALHFGDGQVLVGYLLLDPQLGCVYVTDLSKARPAGDRLPRR